MQKVRRGWEEDVKGPCLDLTAQRVENRNHVPVTSYIPGTTGQQLFGTMITYG